MRKASTMWKGAAVGLAAIAAVGGWAPSAHASATCGDLNGDGQAKIGDALVLLQTVANPPGAGTLCGGSGAAQCGDMNNDGTLSIADVVIYLNFLAGNPTLFPICSGPGVQIGCTGGGDGPAGDSLHQADDHTTHWNGQHRISGDVNSTQTWIAGCRYNIDGLVFVSPGVTLTIQPGALIAGVPPTTGSNTSALVFKRGSKINAKGTASAPIIMTSANHLDTVAGGSIGDWGGLTINGNAPVNCPGGECLAEGLVGIPFGGPDANDSSGIAEYLRVEFSGKELTPDNELNIITLNGVGRGTIWDHTQANTGFDDCHEWFGGTVNGKFLVSSGCGDDLHDTQLGTVGKFQYYLGLHYEPHLQNLGNHGFEWDDNENGFDLLPRNSPTVCNATMVGSNLQPSVGLGQTNRGANLRRGTAGRIENTIITEFRSAGLKLDDAATATVACQPGAAGLTGNLTIDHSILFQNGTDTTGGPHAGNATGSFSGNCTPAQFYNLSTASGHLLPTGLNPTGNPADPGAGPDPQMPIVYGTGAPTQFTDLNQFKPANVALVTGAMAMNCNTIDPFFDNAPYVGAFDPSGATWLTTPWISFEVK